MSDRIRFMFWKDHFHCSVRHIGERGQSQKGCLGEDCSSPVRDNVAWTRMDRRETVARAQMSLRFTQDTGPDDHLTLGRGQGRG